MGKVLIIGIDGGTFDIIGPLAKEGKLPNISRLMKDGAHGVLKSTIPPITPIAWASLITGKNPGNHGMFGFVKKNLGSYSTSVCKRDHTDALWCILSEAGKRVIVVNVPMTYPPQKVNGVMISGMNVPSIESDFIFPESTRKEILGTCRYRIDAFIQDMRTADENQIDSMIEEIYEVDECVKKITRSLMDQDWDFLMTVFTGTDRLQHALWKYTDENHPCYDAARAKKYGDVIRDFYCHLDFAIGEIVKMAGDDVTVMLCSDHGFGPHYYTLPLKKWLFDKGYIKKGGNPLYELDFNRSDIESEIRNSVIMEGGRALRILKMLNKGPVVKLIEEGKEKRLRISVNQNSYAGIKQTIQGLSESAQYVISVTAKGSKNGMLLEIGSLQNKKQFNESLSKEYKRYDFFFNPTSPTLELSVRAASFGPYPPGDVTISDIRVIEEFKWTNAKIDHAVGTGGIRINLKGREPYGIVEPSDYEDVRDSFIRDLKSIKNGDDHLFEGVYRREDIYRGKYVEKASDIIPILNSKFKPSAADQNYFEKSERWSGTHNLDGIFVIHGDNIDSAAVSADMTDIAPTVLYLMGVPIPKDMDGKILKQAIKSDFIENSPIAYQTASDKGKQGKALGDEEKIKERLRGLGYIE